jgi:hypothetical protein
VEGRKNIIEARMEENEEIEIYRSNDFDKFFVSFPNGERGRKAKNLKRSEFSFTALLHSFRKFSVRSTLNGAVNMTGAYKAQGTTCPLNRSLTLPLKS